MISKNTVNFRPIGATVKNMHSLQDVAPEGLLYARTRLVTLYVYTCVASPVHEEKNIDLSDMEKKKH